MTAWRRAIDGKTANGMFEGKEIDVPTALPGHRGSALAVVASAPPIILQRRKPPEPCAHCGARSYSICGAIDDDDLAPLATLAVVTEVDAGRTFIEEGEPAESFFNITSGTAKLYKMLPDGRRQIIGFARSGDFLGLAVSSVYTFSAEAIDAVRFCRFSRPRLRKLLTEFPKLERRLLEVAANELVVAQEQMLLLGRKTARERVASFLMAQAGQMQERVTRGGPTPGGQTHIAPTQTGITQPGMTQPGMTQPGTTQTGMTQPGTTHAGAAHAGMTYARITHAGMATAGMAHAPMAHAPMAHAGTAQAGIAQTRLNQGDRRPFCGARDTCITLAMTRGDIADYLGLTIETVSRTLSRLRADGLISIPSTSDVVILNCGALEKLAGGLD